MLLGFGVGDMRAGIGIEKMTVNKHKLL